MTLLHPIVPRTHPTIAMTLTQVDALASGPSGRYNSQPAEPREEPQDVAHASTMPSPVRHRDLDQGQDCFGQREVDGSGPRSPLRCNLAVFSKAFRAGPNFNIAEHSTKTGNLS